VPEGGDERIKSPCPFSAGSQRTVNGAHFQRRWPDIPRHRLDSAPNPAYRERRTTAFLQDRRGRRFEAEENVVVSKTAKQRIRVAERIGRTGPRSDLASRSKSKRIHHSYIRAVDDNVSVAAMKLMDSQATALEMKCRYFSIRAILSDFEP
jgi:hypothetical protein